MMHPFYLLMLFGFQLLGELVHGYAELPIPGAILGMLFLLSSFIVFPPGSKLKTTALTLIRYLPLFFIPAGVGIMAYEQQLMENLWPILATLFLATPIGFALSLCVFRRLVPDQNQRKGEP